MRMVGEGAARPDECGRWVSDVPLHGRFDPYEGAGCAADRDGDGWDRAAAEGEDEPPEPAWAVDAWWGVLRERLAGAVADPAGLDAAGVIEALSASLPGAVRSTGQRGCAIDAEASGEGVPTVDAGALVDGIRVVQRLVNHYQAVQQQWIAALARPGVAIPLEQLVGACQHPGGRVPGALRPPAELPDELPTGADGEPDLRPLLEHPAWRAPLADTAARLASAEVGCALRIAPTTARARVEKSLAVVDNLPATYAAQYAGDLDGYRVSIITDRTDVLTGPQRARVEQRVLPGAESRTPAALRDQVDRAVVAADPEAAARRVTRARAGRGVRLDKDRDDMAELRATIGCTDGHLAFGVLDEQAAALDAAGLAGGRGMSQLRADVLCDLFRTLAETGHAHLTTARHHAKDGVADGGVAGGGGSDDTGTSSAGSSHADIGDAGRGVDGDRARAGRGGADTSGAGGPGSGATDGEKSATSGSGVDAEGADAGDDSVGGGAETGARWTGVQPCPGYCPGTHPGRAGHGPGGPPGSVAGRRRSTAVNVYIDAATLAGLDDQAGELAGYGSITAATARALAASADTVRALITRPGIESGAPPGRSLSPRPGHSSNPARSRTCGTILDAGRAVYRPPEALMDYVTARDRTCSWPGCRAPAQRCDVDHRRAHDEGGATCACNLDLLCRWHHRVKTFTAWHAEPGPDGTLVWTSPTGHRYPTECGHSMLDSRVDTLGLVTTSTMSSAVPPRRGPAGHESVPGTCPARGDPADDPPPF